MFSWIIQRGARWLAFGGDPLSRSGKVFVLGVILLGVPIILHCLFRCWFHESWMWAGLAALAVALASLPWASRSVHEKVGMTLCDVLVFLAIFLQGPEAGVAVAVAEGITFNFRRRVHRGYRQIFNLAQIAIVALFAGQVFYLTYGAAMPLNREAVSSPSILLLAAAACGLYYYLMTSGLVARAVAFSCNQRFEDIWIRCLGQAHITSVGALLGAVIFLTFS